MVCSPDISRFRQFPVNDKLVVVVLDLVVISRWNFQLCLFVPYALVTHNLLLTCPLLGFLPLVFFFPLNYLSIVFDS